MTASSRAQDMATQHQSNTASIPEAGHAAFWEEPDTWNRLALDFLADK